MWRKSRWLFIGAAVAALVVLFGLGRIGLQGRGVAPPAAAAPDRFAVEEGGRLYGRYCLPCHGESGRGDGRFFASSLNPAPADFADSAFRKSRTDQQLRDAITGGSVSVGKSDLCPAWGKTFSPTEIEYLIVYIRQLQKKEESL